MTAGGGLVGVEITRIVADNPKSQLPQLRFAEQPGVGLDGQQQPVVAQKSACERVVGADRRRLGVDGVDAQTRTGEAGQPRADPAQQLGGRLAGERQAQHLAGVGESVGDQPHHPRGHGLGLACARTRDHDERARRRGDHRGLLVGGRRQAQRVGQFGGAVTRCHDRARCAGQLARTGQWPQLSLMRARKAGPTVAAAARCTVCRHSCSAVRCQRVLVAFDDARLAEVDQPTAAGLSAALDDPGRHRELVERQLRVPLGVVFGGRVLAGLDVHDHQPAGDVAFQAVDAAADPDVGQVGIRTGQHTVDVDFGGDLGQLVAGLGAPLAERRQHRPCRANSLREYHRGVERQSVPDLFELVDQLCLGHAGGDQRVQHGTQRRAHVASVGAAVALQQPAQRAVRDRLHRRRRKCDRQAVVLGQRLLGADRGCGRTRSPDRRPAHRRRRDAPTALRRNAVWPSSTVPAGAHTTARNRPTSAAGASTRGRSHHVVVGVIRSAASARRRTPTAPPCRRCRCRRR